MVVRLYKDIICCMFDNCGDCPLDEGGVACENNAVEVKGERIDDNTVELDSVDFIHKILNH